VPTLLLCRAVETEGRILDRCEALQKYYSGGAKVRAQPIGISAAPNIVRRPSTGEGGKKTGRLAQQAPSALFVPTCRFPCAYLKLTVNRQKMETRPLAMTETESWNRRFLEPNLGTESWN